MVSIDVEALTDALSLCYMGLWRSFGSFRGDSSIPILLLIITSSRPCTDSLIPSPSFMLSTPIFLIHLAVMAEPLLHPSYMYVNMVTFWNLKLLIMSCHLCHVIDASYIGRELRHNIWLRSARFLKVIFWRKKHYISC